MTPFEWALREEEKWVCDTVEKPMPVDWPMCGKRVYIGPAKPPLAGTHYLDSTNATLLPPEETNDW